MIIWQKEKTVLKFTNRWPFTCWRKLFKRHYFKILRITMQKKIMLNRYCIITLSTSCFPHIASKMFVMILSMKDQALLVLRFLITVLQERWLCGNISPKFQSVNDPIIILWFNIWQLFEENDSEIRSHWEINNWNLSEEGEQLL